MKHLSFRLRQLALLVAITSFFAAGAATISNFPYSETNFKTSGWTKSSSSSSSNGWTVSSGPSCQSSIGSGVCDSWLFSPEINVKGGYIYTFSCTVSADRSNYPVSVVDFYILPTASKTATPIKQFSRITTSADNMSVDCSMEFEATEDASVYFAIADMTNGSDKGWYTTVKDLSISEEANIRAPKAVEGLAYSTSGDDGTTVTLSWSNPSLDTFGDPASIKQIRIDANGEPYATLAEAPYTTPGEAVTYTDPQPRSGIITYAVTVVADDDAEGKTVSLTTEYIGPFAGLNVPIELPFKNSPFNPIWKFANDEATSIAWLIDEDKDCMSISVNNSSAIDATATSPGFNLSADKAYRLTYNETSSNPSNHINYSLELVGETAMTLREMTLVDQKSQTRSFDFTPTETGQLCFRWHATAEKMSASYYNNTVSVSGITVEELPVIPTIATGLTATAATDGTLQVELAWTNPSVSPTGLPLTGLTATIIRDGVEVAAIPAEAGAQGTFTDTPELCGYHNYSVVISNANGASPEHPEKVTADFVGDAVGLPFTADFLNANYLWYATEWGELANGNTFTFSDSQNWAMVTEKATEFADILASAPVALKAGHTYKAVAKCANSTYSSLNVDLLLIRSLADLESAETPVVISNKSVSSGDTEVGDEFSVSETGNYIFAVRVNASSYGSSTYTFYVKGFTAEEVATVPAAVTDLAAVSHPTKDGEVSITMTLPTESTRGAALEAELTANIWHANKAEGEPIAQLTGMPGETVTWSHTEAATGINNYTVTVTLPDTEIHGMGGTSEAVSIESDWCGAGHDVPFESNFADEAHRNLWTIADQSGTYTLYSFHWDEDAQAMLVEESSGRNSTSSNLDDWLITPPLYILDDAIYYITMEVKANGGTSTYSDYSPIYSIYIGNSIKPADFVNKGAQIATKVKLNKEQEYATYKHTFSYSPLPDENGEIAAFAEGSTLAPSKKFMAFRFGEKYTTAYPYAEVRKISIDTNHPTGIESVSNDTETTELYYDGMKLTASRDAAMIEVYSLSGALVTAGRGEVATDMLPGGVYIVRCDATTLKFSK